MSDSELNDLYQEVIIDHSKHPRNCHVCENANHIKEGYNPLCGDKIKLYVKEKNGIIEDVCFQNIGCAISTASASLMSEAIKGKTVAEALKLFEEFQALLTLKEAKDSREKLGKLAVLAGVAEYPMRVKCATLPWHTLKAALTDDEKNVAK
jgi:nitrogen fixation protein NifU and related proteins